MAALAVKRDIDGAVLLRIGRALAQGARIIRREDAADEGDDDEAEAPVIAQGVDIPPAIAARRNRGIEARSAIRLEAASEPDSAAIGTPGPGWMLPPQR